MYPSALVLCSWSPLDFDPGALFWTFAVFGVVCLVLGKFVWAPLLKALDEREKKIAGGLKEAELAREEAKRFRAEFEVQVREARAEAKRMAEEARTNAARLAETIESEARAKSEQMLAGARQEIELVKRQAQEEIRTLAVDLAMEAATAVLRRNVSNDDNRRIAAEVVGSMKGA